VALPEADEETAPAFAHHGSEDLPTYEQGGLWARLIAGEAFGAKAKVPTRSPMFYVHWRLEAGTSAGLPDNYAERAVYVAVGSVDVDGRSLKAGEMAILAAGKPSVVKASTAAIVMALGGEPLGRRFIEWNFVSSRKERIDQAKADWRAGRMKLPDLDNGEFIPLPGDPAAPPNPLS
jgi:redox-sensitive bicupin YhaK (pirin superfamily)